ncbi:MAG: phage major tail protein, TP901-1 family [Pseudomonadota bacterium]
MGLQRGSDMVLSVADGLGGFQTIGGMRARRVSFNSAAVDTTSADNKGWRELLSNGGLRQVSVSGRGIFVNGAAAARLRTLFFDGQHATWQLAMVESGTVSGPFQITGFDYSGDTVGEMQFSLSLQSAGVVTFAEVGG